jgi:hypothetical protein
MPRREAGFTATLAAAAKQRGLTRTALYELAVAKKIPSLQTPSGLLFKPLIVVREHKNVRR